MLVLKKEVSALTAFQERCNWDGEDPGKDNLNDTSSGGIAM